MLAIIMCWKSLTLGYMCSEMRSPIQINEKACEHSQAVVKLGWNGFSDALSNEI